MHGSFITAARQHSIPNAASQAQLQSSPYRLCARLIAAGLLAFALNRGTVSLRHLSSKSLDFTSSTALKHRFKSRIAFLHCPMIAGGWCLEAADPCLDR
jgi:hypothetical protein